jgi:hypothetical protein
VPTLTPTLLRKKSLAEEIASLDVMAFQTMLLRMAISKSSAKGV